MASGRAPVKIIGHRGASAAAPENTLRSVCLAWDLGADAVEVDLRLSQDNHIMVSHDDSTGRVSKVDWKISATTATELRKLDVGSWKGEQFAGERMPYLEEVLAAIPPGKKLVVEIKCGREIFPRLHEILDHSAQQDQIILIGFDLATMAAAKKEFPRIPVWWLRGTEKDPVTKAVVPHSTDWIRIARENRLDGLDVHFAGLTREFAHAVRAAGLALYAWTVDDVTEARRLKALEVEGLTTNQPDRLRKALR